MKVKVSAKIERFRRAGLEFTREPREVEVDKKTLAVLQVEPMLAVEVLKEEKKDDGGAAAKDPKDLNKETSK